MIRRTALVIALVVCSHASAQDRRGPVTVSEEALKLHRSALVFDGHNDLPWQFREHNDWAFRRLDIARSQPSLHTDIARLRQGNVGAQF